MLRLKKRCHLRSFWDPLVPWVLRSLQKSFSHLHGNRRRNTIRLSVEDPPGTATQMFLLPKIQAAVAAAGLPSGVKPPQDTQPSSPQHSAFPPFLFPHSIPLFIFSWKWLKVRESLLGARLKASPPSPDSSSRWSGEAGEPGSQLVCGRDTCQHGWAGCEEAPHSATRLSRCWGVDFRAPVCLFSPLPAWYHAPRHWILVPFFHHSPSSFLGSHCRS